jgi:very-short-patch-repair endonuclease
MARLSGETKKRARELRHEPTEAEKLLWAHLRNGRLNGWRFRRQHPVPPHVVDFACVSARLVVEADGGQHAESERDRRRDRFIRSRGWRILRFWNHDILANPAGVIEAIAAALPPPRPSPAPRAGEGAAAAPAEGGPDTAAQRRRPREPA